MGKLAAVAVVLCALPAAAVDCSLDGEGDVALCEKVFWRSRIAGVVVPAYTVAVDSKGVQHGMTWNLSFDLPRTLWESYFRLGSSPPPPTPGAPQAFHVNVGASALWLPGVGDFEGRLALRLRVISLVWPNNPGTDPLHLWVGVGAFAGTRGYGPRLELRLRLGHLAWGGLMLAGGFEPDPLHNRFTGDFSLGFDAPWVWWW